MEIKDSALEHAYLSVWRKRLSSWQQKNRRYEIVWHGAVKKGNADLYLSKSSLVGAHAGVAAANLLLIVVQAYRENYRGAISAMKTAIKQTVTSSKVKSGKIFEMHHWTSIKVKNQ